MTSKRQKIALVILSIIMLLSLLSAGVMASYIRNKMPPYLLSFQQTVFEQARVYPEDYIVSLPTQDKTIALTFDDGPIDASTALILDILKEEGVSATFFVVGNAVAKHPELALRIVEEGHTIGNHSWSHPDLRSLSNQQILETEIAPTSELIQEITGYYPKLIRPPYGALRDDTIEFLAEDGWSVALWSIDSFDWDPAQNTPLDILAKIEDYHHPGAIILLHCNGAGTVEALPMLIRTLRDLGYDFSALE